MAYGSGLLVICAPGDVEVYFDCLLVRKVIVVQVYWLHVHQVTLRFFIYLLVRKVIIIQVYWLRAHQVTLRFTSFHFRFILCLLCQLFMMCVNWNVHAYTS